MAFQLCASRHFKSNIGPTDNLSFSGVHSQSECVCVLILSHTSFSFENGAPRFRHSIGMTQKSRFLFTTESSGEIAKPTELIAPAMSSYFSHDARTVRHMIWAVDIEHSEHSAQKKTRSHSCILLFTLTRLGRIISAAKRESLYSCKFPAEHSNWNEPEIT